MAPSNLISEISAAAPASTITLLNYFARLNAWSTISLMGFVIFVAFTSFRKGRPWAWYVMLWFFASAFIAYALEILNGGAYRNSELALVILVLPFVLGLLLPYRKFFPKKREPVS
jgi:hypothetical protein